MLTSPKYSIAGHLSLFVSKGTLNACLQKKSLALNQSKDIFWEAL